MDDTAQPAEGGPTAPAPPAPRIARQSQKAPSKFPHKFAISTFASAILVAIAALAVARMPARSPANTHDITRMMAKITRPMPDGINCQRVIFDNASSQTIEEKIEPCQQSSGPPKPRARSMMNWNGK
jgi:hypothetical protein